MYNEPEKITIRKEVISNAIKILIDRRNESTITNANNIRKIKNHIIKKPFHQEEKDTASKLTDDTINSWEKYYTSLLVKKEVSNLKVAF